MPNTISLSAYVKKRNGVALGASGSMRNMFKRSLGADSFYLFWRYWNPIWGSYLSRYVMKPMLHFLPAWLAVFLTFAVSGAIHDMAVTVVNLKWTFFFTPWFFLMGIIVVFGRLVKLDYAARPFPIRVTINVSLVVACLMLTLGLQHIL